MLNDNKAVLCLYLRSKVLVNRLEDLASTRGHVPRKSVSRLTDRLDMTLTVLTGP